MDTAFYYYRRKGQQVGPYKFYQLQQIKTEERVSPEDFEPEEWEQFAQFVETGELPKTTRFIERVETQDGAPKAKPRPLLKHLTYVSYCIAAVFIAAGLLQGENEYILRSRPAFYLGLFFSIALCHAFVDRGIRRKLTQSPQSTSLQVLVWYLAGLMPLAVIVGLAAAAAEMLLRRENLSAAQVFDIGSRYFAAGALLSSYRAFYLRTISIDEKLLVRKPHSVSWLLALLSVTALVAFYVAPVNSMPTAMRTAHDKLFVREQTEAADSRLAWQYPVKLGDTLKMVEKTMGTAQEVIGREHIYRSAGLRVMFDEQNHVSKMRFVADDRATVSKTPILAGISLQSNFRQIETLLQTPPATFKEAASQTSVWVEPPYRLLGCFWKEDGKKNGKAYKAGDLKWIEITLEQ